MKPGTQRAILIILAFIITNAFLLIFYPINIIDILTYIVVTGAIFATIDYFWIDNYK